MSVEKVRVLECVVCGAAGHVGPKASGTRCKRGEKASPA